MSDLPSTSSHSGTQSKHAITAGAKPSKTLGLHALPASKGAIRVALREVYDEAGTDPPNVNRASDLVKIKLPHARRARIREVLREPEFARQRRPPGRKAKARSTQPTTAQETPATT